MKSIDINFTATNSFVPTALVNQTTILDTTNFNFFRQVFLSNNGVKIVKGSSVVNIPMSQIFKAAYSADPTLTWAPVIADAAQPTSSTVYHNSASYFAVSASAETTMSFSWQSQSGSGIFHTCATDISASRFTGSLTPALTASNSNGLDQYNFRCIVGNVAGFTTSSTATLTTT